MIPPFFILQQGTHCLHFSAFGSLTKTANRISMITFFKTFAEFKEPKTPSSTPVY